MEILLFGRLRCICFHVEKKNTKKKNRKRKTIKCVHCASYAKPSNDAKEYVYLLVYCEGVQCACGRRVCVFMCAHNFH